MKQHIRRQLYDDRGTQIVEWVGFTGAIVGLIIPAGERAVWIDPATGVRQEIDLETAWRMGMVTVQEEPPASASWIPAPAIGVPALLAGGR